MREVHLTYFARLGELAGISEEDRNTGAENLAELYREIAGERNLPEQTDSIRVALNDEFAHWQDGFEHGDRIAFLPPVSGG